MPDADHDALPKYFLFLTVYMAIEVHAETVTLKLFSTQQSLREVTVNGRSGCVIDMYPRNNRLHSFYSSIHDIRVSSFRFSPSNTLSL